MLRKILIALAIAIPLAYGGAKLYVVHSINGTVHEMIAMVAPVARITYQGTTSSLFTGMVGVTGVTVQTLKNSNFYRIGAVKLKSDNIFTFMGMNIARGNVPKMFDVELDKLTMDLSGEMLDKAHGDLGLMGDLHTPFGILACGKRSGFSESDLEDMGIDQITTNINVKVVREPEQNDIRMMTHIDTPGINAVTADMSFVAPHGALNPRSAMRSAPQLKAFTLRFRDQGWHKRVQAFCTKQTGMTRTAYLDAHVAAVKAALARMGYRVSNDLVAAYRSFLKDGGSMTLSITPQSPIDISDLSLYSVPEAIDYLAPTLQVNGKMVRQLDVAKIKTRTVHSTMAEVAMASAGHNDSYREIPLYTLRRHIGQQVRLTTDNDYVFAGKLLKVGNRSATLDASTYGWNHQELVLLSHVAKTELMIPAR